MHYWPSYFILKQISVTGQGREIPISFTDHFLITSWPRGLSTMEFSLCGMTRRILLLTKCDRFSFEAQTWGSRSEWIHRLDSCIISVAVPEGARQRFSSLQEQTWSYIYIYSCILFRNYRVQCSLESRKTQPKECRSRVKFIAGGTSRAPRVQGFKGRPGACSPLRISNLGSLK